MWRIQLKPISTDTQQPSPHKPEWQEVAITHFDFDGYRGHWRVHVAGRLHRRKPPYLLVRGQILNIESELWRFLFLSNFPVAVSGDYMYVFSGQSGVGGSGLFQFSFLVG